MWQLHRTGTFCGALYFWAATERSFKCALRLFVKTAILQLPRVGARVLEFRPYVFGFGASPQFVHQIQCAYKNSQISDISLFECVRNAWSA